MLPSFSRAEHIFTRIDLLTATEASENIWTSVAYSPRADRQQVTIGLQCVADIPQRSSGSTICQSALAQGRILPEFKSAECAVGQRDGASSPLRDASDL